MVEGGRLSRKEFTFEVNLHDRITSPLFHDESEGFFNIQAN